MKWCEHGHPMRSTDVCRVCHLLLPYDRRHDWRWRDAHEKWAHRQRAANSFKPSSTSWTGRWVDEFASFAEAIIACGAQPNGAFPVDVDMPDLASEWHAAINRICPVRSRTIVWPPVSKFATIDALHEMIAGAGREMVHQQAAMKQNLIDFSLLGDP